MGDVIEILTTATNTVEVEAQGPQGIPGVGVPTGGSALQVLRKKTSTDYDTEWATGGGGASYDQSLNTTDSVTFESVAADKVAFDLAAAETAAQGQLAWNADEETLDLGLAHGSVLQVGQETLYHVENSTASTITAGTLCVFSGTVGNSGKLRVAPHANNTNPTAILGVATSTIAAGVGEEGYVTHFGKCRGINASGGGEAWANGDLLYASPTGGLTKTKPAAPIVTVAAVVSNSSSSGTLFVRPSFGQTAADVGAAPTSHAASHAAAGSDPLAPSDIGAQSIFVTESLVLTSATRVDLTAARAKLFDVVQYAGATATVRLPDTGSLVGDVFIFRWGTGSDSVNVQNSVAPYLVLGNVSLGQQLRFIRGSASWTLVPVDTHTHAATAISDSTTAGRALLTGADAAAQRTTLGLGTAATSATGDFAAASHVHGNLTNDGKIGSTSGLPLVTATAGAVTTLALGTAGQILRTKSDLSGVEFADPAASGVTGAASSASDVLGVSGANITGVDANADRIVFWDDSASALKYLEAGSGLSISGTTLTATASGGSKTYAVFTATDNQPPATNFMTLDTRNGIAVLDADDATDESAVFVGIIPEGASLGSGLKIRLHWMATTATSGNVVWDVSLERMTTDLDTDSFDTIASGTTAASGTSGILTVTEITLTTIDSVTAGDGFRLKVTRDANNASDTMTGDAELVVCEVRSAA